MQNFDAATALSIAQQVAAGLMHVHRSGVVHRDVRAANVLVVSTQPLRVVLADFGVSYRITRSADPRCCLCCRGGAGSVSPTAAAATAAGHGGNVPHGRSGVIDVRVGGDGCENPGVDVLADTKYGVDVGALPLHVMADDPRAVRWSRLPPQTVRRNPMVAVGPIAWMAHEEVIPRGQNPGATTMSDVFMFGGLLFEILTAGLRPYFWIEGEQL